MNAHANIYWGQDLEKLLGYYHSDVHIYAVKYKLLLRKYRTRNQKIQNYYY